MSTETVKVQVLRWNVSDSRATETDTVAVEEPLEIRVADRSVAVVMRTPGEDRELAAGFLLTEGVIKSADELLDVLRCRDQDGGASGNVVNAVVAPRVTIDFQKLTRHVFSSSSCGVCGKATLDAIKGACAAVSEGPRFDPKRLVTLPDRLRAKQSVFALTGGLHACALFDQDGELSLIREDVGRHNAVDKVLGRSLIDGRLPLRTNGLLLSGRISFELVQKALAAGVPMVVGIGAPSSLAIECARQGNVTLVGFLRADRFNVYSGGSRLEGQGELKP